MEIAVVAGLFTKRYVQINSGQFRLLFSAYYFYKIMVNEDSLFISSSFVNYPLFLMAKVKFPVLFVLLMIAATCAAQTSQNYSVRYIIVDSLQQQNKTDIQSDFSSLMMATAYVDRLPVLLQGKGYITASLDSVYLDSLNGTVHLFLGQQYKWAKLRTEAVDADLLDALRWNESMFTNAPVQFDQLQKQQQQMLAQLEDMGYPFAKIYLDSIDIKQQEVEALLKVYRGPLYKIDSIRVYGNAKVSNEFLQRYLNIPNGSIYSKKKLQDISRKLSQLAYIEEEKPSDLSLLGTGSVLNLYLKEVKNSQVNALIGFLPNPNTAAAKKLQISGEANVLLRNALGGGETIGVNWQQLQVKSPRLNLLFEQPYIFRSPFGLLFNFDMFRKDSTFLNIDMRLGANYGAGEVQSGSLFLQRRQSIINGINIDQVMFTRTLPPEADVSSTSLGVAYIFNNTDYRINPREGVELNITTSAGTKKIKKNNQVLQLKDAANPSFNFEKLYDTVKLKTYQFRITAAAARYFPVGRQSTFKAGVQSGLFNSGNIFRNEVFQIGGYKLLRGFDEESQYVSQYAVATAEYRYLIGRASNFFAFADGGWAKHLGKQNHTYIGAGLGLSFETGAGIFNLVWALGKRDDTEFNLRQSKVHIGFVNYF